MPQVYIKFPKTGLGNMMLVWAKGLVFAKLNSIPLYCSSWWGFRWGTLLRWEKKKRFYGGYFKETPLLKRMIALITVNTLDKIYNPEVIKIPFSVGKRKLYVFDKVLANADMFGILRDHKEFIKEAIYEQLTERIKCLLQQQTAPLIGLHIRRGDFKVSNQTTPLQYFIDAIEMVRTSLGQPLTVTVFTDASKQELSSLLSLPNIVLSTDKPDIIDLLLLSKSKIMILSKSSTFGYWAAFLSDAVVIKPTGDWQQLIKQNVAAGYTEVKVDGFSQAAQHVINDAISSVHYEY